MNPYFLILTDYALRMPQKITWRQSYDISKICDFIHQADLFPIVTHYEDPNLYNLITTLGIRYCWPSHSWLPGYRQKVESVLVTLHSKGITLIPKLCHFLAYENKGLVTEMMNNLGIPCPRSYHVSTVEGVEGAALDVGYPFVAKSRTGFASSGVQLISNPAELDSLISREFIDKRNDVKNGDLVVQEFIPGLAGDWKVIVVGNIAATLWRRTRPDDFRASGSGLFVFKKAPDELLEFAFRVRIMLDAPWASLDIAETNQGCKVLEYQVVHFGTTTVDKATEHYVRHEDGTWEVVPGRFDVEREFVDLVLAEIKP